MWFIVFAVSWLGASALDSNPRRERIFKVFIRTQNFYSYQKHNKIEFLKWTNNYIYIPIIN